MNNSIVNSAREILFNKRNGMFVRSPNCFGVSQERLNKGQGEIANWFDKQLWVMLISIDSARIIRSDVRNQELPGECLNLEQVLWCMRIRFIKWLSRTPAVVTTLHALQLINKTTEFCKRLETKKKMFKREKEGIFINSVSQQVC